MIKGFLLHPLLFLGLEARKIYPEGRNQIFKK